MSIRLESESGDGFHCPHCERTLRVQSWDTEYNDPQPGDHRVCCPCCSKAFTIDVYVDVIIHPRIPLK